MKTKYVPPEWAFEFHGHRCPFMPIGYRMGKVAMEHLGVDREKDHGFFVFVETGIGHPQGCMADGIQVATGATYAKGLMEKTFYGKLAATFYHQEKGAVRYSLRPEFIDEMGKFEFFAYRRKGVQPSAIPQKVSDEVINWVYEQTDEFMFKVEPKPDFKFTQLEVHLIKQNAASAGSMYLSDTCELKTGNRFVSRAPAMKKVNT